HWLKSPHVHFYEIDYYWKKGEHPKRAKFNPDFFIVVGDLVQVVELKDDGEIKEPSPENIKKYQFAIEHFEILNHYLQEENKSRVYHFNFLTPKNFSTFF